MKKSLLALAVSGLVIVGNPAFAAGPYVVGQLGQSDVDAGEGVFADSLDDTDTYFGVGIGYKVTENIAFEIGYHDFGKAEADYGSTFPGGFETGTESLELNSVSFAAVGILPLSPSFSLFGKLGLDVWEVEWKDQYQASEDGFDYSGSEKLDDDGTGIFLAVGATFDLTANTAVFIEYQLHQFDLEGAAYETEEGFYEVDYEIDADVLNVGINYSF